MLILGIEGSGRNLVKVRRLFDFLSRGSLITKVMYVSVYLRVICNIYVFGLQVGLGFWILQLVPPDEVVPATTRRISETDNFDHIGKTSK